MKAIRRALISVSNKEGLVPFAKLLREHNVEILSTGGTLAALKAAGIPAKAVEEITGFPEVFEGRVKTLHPKIHGGLLYRRDKKTHQEEADRLGIEAIDLVVVNLYPFEEVTKKHSVTLEEAIENIDIGGPSMLRSAAKNFKSVTVVCDPADYWRLMKEIQRHKGKVSASLREELAFKVFERTANYDRHIAEFMSRRNGKEKAGKESPAPKSQDLPSEINLHYEKLRDLRYGENPNQKAGLYVPKGAGPLRYFNSLHGKELSFNNLLDIEATIDVLREFERPAACVIKHNNPSGIAENGHLADAMEQAIECDAMSAFGGVLGVNRPCDLETARRATDRLHFFEVFAAPSFRPEALRLLKERKNLRLIEIGKIPSANPWDIRVLQEAVLLQERDLPLQDRIAELEKNLRVVTREKLNAAELDRLLFAFKCVKLVKSNAIVITQGKQTVGIGAGQMARVDAVEIACRKAGYRTDDGILASDAFFPMPDSIEVARQYKIRTIIQPGGSLKDADVIAACDRVGIAMVFTGERHFRH